MSQPRKTILFIEDQELHYEQVAAYLRLHGYDCRRLSRAESREVGQKVTELKPLAAILDFVLPSAAMPQAEVDRAATAHLQGKPEPAADADPQEKEQYGVDNIPLLRKLCPGIKILVYTQYANRDEVSKQAALYQADAGVPKRRDLDGNLLEHNAQEIAAKVRELIE